eukprot:scaffold75361_cov55-Phaeocystis_antarctica.AAC.3
MRAQLPLLVVLLLTAADCLSLAKGPSRRSPQPRLAKNAKKPKVFNLVCAGCGVECSGETCFIDHIHPKPKPKPTPTPTPKPKPKPKPKPNSNQARPPSSTTSTARRTGSGAASRASSGCCPTPTA